jgi:hypothetical protein
VLVMTATPVAQFAISRRSSRASRVALTPRMVAHLICQTRPWPKEAST